MTQMVVAPGKHYCTVCQWPTHGGLCGKENDEDDQLTCHLCVEKHNRTFTFKEAYVTLHISPRNTSLVGHWEEQEKKAKEKAASSDDDEDDNTPSKKRKVVAPGTPARKKDIPASLLNMRESDYTKIIVGDEINQKAKTADMQGLTSVATGVQLEDGSVYDLKLLSLDQLRKLAGALGVVAYSGKTKFETRQAMALRKTAGAAYKNCAAINPDSATATSGTNMRIINTLFLPEFYEQFTTINDRKDRKDFEVGNGANNRRFWASISDSVNDTEMDEIMVLPDNDVHISSAVDLGEVDCSVFTQQTWSTCSKKVSLLAKIRNIINDNMTISGNHESDPWTYVPLALQQAKSKERAAFHVNAIEAYYFFIKCREYPECNSMFQVFLANNIKGTSTDNAEDWNASNNNNDNNNNSLKSNKSLAGIKQTLDDSMKSVTAATIDAKADRAEIMELFKADQANKKKMIAKSDYEVMFNRYLASLEAKSRLESNGNCPAIAINNLSMKLRECEVALEMPYSEPHLSFE
jgi:hypothetical protein